MKRFRLLVIGCFLASVLAVAGTAQGRPASTTVVVHLGPHVFGHTRGGQRVVSARWGTGRDEIGRWQGQGGPQEGGSSFDVDRAGNVFLLDGVNGRVAIFRPDGRLRAATPLNVGSKAHLQVGDVFDNVNSELAVGTDGTIYVLEPKDIFHDRWQKLWSFSRAGGRPLATALTAGETVRADGATAVVSAPPGGCGKTCPQSPQHWRSLMHRGRLEKGDWLRYRPFGDGSRLQVRLDVPHGRIGVMLTSPDGSHVSWLVRSAPDFGVLVGIELAGRNVVLVFQVANDSVAEYDVSELGEHGIVDRFSVPFDEYTEVASGGHFRTRGSSLYHLGTTATGVYVARYDLTG